MWLCCLSVFVALWWVKHHFALFEGFVVQFWQHHLCNAAYGLLSAHLFLLSFGGGRTRLVSFAMNDGFQETRAAQLKSWNVRQLLAVLIASILQDLHPGHHRRVKLNLMRKVDTISNRLEPHGLTEVIGLSFSEDEAFESVDLGLRNWLKHREFNYVSCAVVGNRKLSTALNTLTFFTIKMVDEGLSCVHGRCWYPWRPIVLRIVPLSESVLLLGFWVPTLVRQMVLIVAKLLKHRPFLLVPNHFVFLLRLQVFLHPLHKVLFSVTIGLWFFLSLWDDFNLFNFLINIIVLRHLAWLLCKHSSWIRRKHWRCWYLWRCLTSK